MPHRCGIATFSGDLAAAIDARYVVALHPPTGPVAYPPEVRQRIRKDVLGDYHLAANRLNASSVDVVSIQHEYGIWGGRDGAYVLDFVDALRQPVVNTLHTVKRTPTQGQRQVLKALIDRSAATVVMSSSAASLLTRAYGVSPGRVEVVAHGVPDLPLVDPASVKPGLGLAGRLVILSFGLLGPGKGYEAVIEAMPQVARTHPSALYVVLGATHPDLLAHEGEAYRDRLTALTARLGVSANVRFVDRFVDRDELGTWLEAADVFVTPYPNLEQIVSGTLSFAMGAGKAVVSTPYAYATERLADGRGWLLEDASTASLAEAFGALLGDPDLRGRYGLRAYRHTRSMIWPRVGETYARIFARVAQPARHIAEPAMAMAAARG